MARLQELMQRTVEPEMIESEIYNSVIEAVKENLIGTQLLALRIGPQGIPGSEVSIVMQDKDSMVVHELAEGQEVPIEVENVSDFTLKPKKYGLRPLITREMIEDNKWDIIQRNLREAGYQMAKKLDSLILSQIEAGADANSTAHKVDWATGLSVANVASAMKFLEEDGYTPTDFIISAGLAEQIRGIDTFVEADKAKVTDPSKSLIGTIFGMRVWRTNQVTADYGYIIDSRHALVLAEKRPITIERYDDVARDLSGVVVTARWKARYLRKEACCYLYT